MSAWTAASVAMKAAGVEFSRFGGEYVLLDASGTMLRGLNETAGRVWELVDGRRSAAEIAADVARQYRVESDRVLPDVLTLLVHLSDRKLLEQVT